MSCETRPLLLRVCVPSCVEGPLSYRPVPTLPGTRVPGYPTDESSTRFRFAGSITRIGNCTLINFILINDDAINKAYRKTYHWKRQNISFATRYPLN